MNDKDKTAKDYNVLQYEKNFWEFNDTVNRLRDQFRKEIKITKENKGQYFPDTEERPGLKIDDTFTQNPDQPGTPQEAFELLKKYYAALWCELEKNMFLNSNSGIINQTSVEEELGKINQWIKETGILKITDANLNDILNIKNEGHPKYEYKRLISGFYDGYRINAIQLQEHSLPAMVYGRYFLFKEWLEKQMIPEDSQSQDLQSKQEPQSVAESDQVTFWHGSAEQKEKLFNQLVEKEFIENADGACDNFFNGKPVKWEKSDRLLITLTEELKKRKHISAYRLQLILSKNFINKRGNSSFTSIKQNKYAIGDNKKVPPGTDIIKGIVNNL